MNNSNEINKIEDASLHNRENPEVEALKPFDKEIYEPGDEDRQGEKTSGVDVVAEELKIAEDVVIEETESPWSLGFRTTRRIKNINANTRIEDSNRWIEALMRKIRERKIA